MSEKESQQTFSVTEKYFVYIIYTHVSFTVKLCVLCVLVFFYSFSSVTFSPLFHSNTRTYARTHTYFDQLEFD